MTETSKILWRGDVPVTVVEKNVTKEGTDVRIRSPLIGHDGDSVWVRMCDLTGDIMAIMEAVANAPQEAR